MKGNLQPVALMPKRIAVAMARARRKLPPMPIIVGYRRAA